MSIELILLLQNIAPFQMLATDETKKVSTVRVHGYRIVVVLYTGQMPHYNHAPHFKQGFKEVDAHHVGTKYFTTAEHLKGFFNANMDVREGSYYKREVLDCSCSGFPLPGRHHVWEPDPAQVLRHLPVNFIQRVFMVWNQHLLHDGKLGEPPAAHFHKLHEGAAGHLALAQADGRKLRAVLRDADQLLVERTQAVGAHDQLHQTGAVEAHAAQDLFADRAAEVEVSDGDLLVEKRPKLILVEEEVHDQIEFGRVPHHGVPAALLDGVEVLAQVLAHHVDTQVFQMDVFL